MARALSACLTLVLASGLARAQAPTLPTPPPSPSSPSGALSKPSPSSPSGGPSKPTSSGAPSKPTPPPSGAPTSPPSGAAATPDAPKPAPKVATKKRRKTPPPPPPPAVELFALNTRETFKLRPDPKGRLTSKQLHGWNRFLRCHHTGRVHQMSTRLAQLIYEVDKHFGFKRILVVAGYRAPRVAREKGNPKSPHKKGVACDFRIEGVPNTELRDYERTLPKVGVGYYPNSEFVHLDVDPLRSKHSAFWIDYSRPGERARYSKNPAGDLEAEKSDTPSDLDEDNELAPLPPMNSMAAGGGQGPQIPGDKGARAPSLSPALQPPAQNP
ncbi:MAG TPA: DUF882 domain-containing protein [Polyangia bacterium]